MYKQRSTVLRLCAWVCLLAVCWGQQAEPLLAQNPCSSKTTCSDCIRTASCAWCFAAEFNGPRCINPDMEREGTAGCDEAYILNPDNERAVDPQYNNELSSAKSRMGMAAGSSSFEESYSSKGSNFSASGSSSAAAGGAAGAAGGERLVQMKPQKVNLKLRINQVQKLTFAYSRAQDYPVDLYYLMDLSKSMKNDKEKLTTLGSLLSATMRNMTSIFRIGFGSFVDKPVMPYVSTMPKNLISPCEGCAAPYGYRNHMSLSTDTNLFEKAVGNADVSGNIDAPEGGFDAIMQAVVCTQQIGWRDQARRLLVVSTDAGFHYAGDGKLGGIVQPNDGKCHMSNNIYTHSTLQDYPSISQINHEVKKHAINVIFAVTAEQISVYEQLSKHIEGSSTGVLSNDSDNIVDLVREQYNAGCEFIQGTFVENYRNLTYKHLMGLKWASTTCQEASFILKVDDDTVYNLERTYALLKTGNYSTALLMGYMLNNTKPRRNKENKWYVTWDEYPRQEYPTYLSGWYYITTPTVAATLCDEVIYHPYFWIDDIFVTGLLTESLGIKLTQLPDKFWLAYYELLECCLNDMIKKSIKCDYVVGPNGGRNNLIVEFNDAIKNCNNRGNCTKRTDQDLDKVCIAHKERQIFGDGGQVEVKYIKLK